jgi:hypothetical protein
MYHQNNTGQRNKGVAESIPAVTIQVDGKTWSSETSRPEPALFIPQD